MKLLRSFFLLVPLLAHAVPAPAEAPRLAVVISIDQFRADYLVRFRPFFDDGGFRRLLEGGADYQDCHHRTGMNATAPGHATLLTGVHANVHGIVANEWRERDTFKLVNSVQDDDAPLVGAAPLATHTPGGVLDDRYGRSPRHLLTLTVGDQLKLRYASNCRVISVSNKDRAAVLLGGRLADAAYWEDHGRFITSRYYAPALPAWVDGFNREGHVEKDFGREWTRLLDAAVYDRVQGPDDAPGEEQRLGLGNTFPHRVDGGAKEITPAFYEAHVLTPFASTLLADFAKRAVQAEQLGHHTAPDLLCISFSEIDYLGHSYGPDSHEMMDAVIRLDRVLADLFATLDAEVGAGRYVVVLSADHGVAPLPERVQVFNRGIPAGRLDWPTLNRSVDGALTAAFGPLPADSYWTLRDAYGYHLNPRALAAKNVTASAAETVVKNELMRSPQIAAAFTRDELLASPPVGDTVLDAYRRSFNAARSQDVVLMPAQYFVDRVPAGTNHGPPYDYDNHVPLIWFGPGIVAGVHPERVATEDLAPTLAALLGVPRPPSAQGRRLF